MRETTHEDDVELPTRKDVLIGHDIRDHSRAVGSFVLEALVVSLNEGLADVDPHDLLDERDQLLAHKAWCTRISFLDAYAGQLSHLAHKQNQELCSRL